MNDSNDRLWPRTTLHVFIYYFTVLFITGKYMEISKGLKIMKWWNRNDFKLWFDGSTDWVYEDNWWRKLCRQGDNQTTVFQMVNWIVIWSVICSIICMQHECLHALMWNKMINLQSRCGSLSFILTFSCYVSSRCESRRRNMWGIRRRRSR